MSRIGEQIAAVKSELPDGVKLIAVSKFKPNEDLMEAYEAGQRLFGENRPQEMAAKAQALPRDIEWHFIGTLQRNKLKMVLPYATLIHSVDSVRLFDDIVKHAPAYCNEERPAINVLLQYRIAQEETKQGFEREEILALLERIASEYDSNPDYKSVNICGLMAMGTLVDVESEEGKRELEKEFSSAKELLEHIKGLNYPFLKDFRELSMGMTSDFHIAVKYGSTYVRVGTRIFGARDYSSR